MRVPLLAGLTVVALTVVPVASADAAEPRTMNDVTIEMSDGITLVGDVHLPAGDGRFPTILNLTPYGPGTYSTRYLEEGYAHVNVDIRGTGRSEGSLCLFCLREQRDVYETVEWVAAQPWSDGHVGMMGGSYQAITPMMGAAHQPPHLDAIVPAVAFTDAYRDIVWHNGIWNGYFVTQWVAAQTGLGYTGTGPTSDLAARVETELAVETRQRPWDGPWYRERSLYNKLHRIQVPTLHTGGWFDGFSRGTLTNFQGLASRHNRMIMSPFTHKGGPAAVGPGVTLNPFDPTSPYNDSEPPPGPEDQALAWFDRFLKGIDNGIEDLPPVLYYDTGAFEWRESQRWPPPAVTYRELYLSGEPSGSSPSLNDGTLTAELPAGDASEPVNFPYDPTTGEAETFSKWGTVAASPHIRVDQRIDESRALTFTTEELTEPLRLAGPMELRFWGATTASDTDWIVKVTDVSPSGESVLLTSGYVRSSHRTWDMSKSEPARPWLPNEEPAPVEPGEVYEHRVDIWDVGHTLQPGHRLRVVVMGGDVPNHEPYPEPATNTLYHSKEHPSRLILTVHGAAGSEEAPAPTTGPSETSAGEIGAGDPMPATGAGSIPVMGLLVLAAAIAGTGRRRRDSDTKK